MNCKQGLASEGNVKVQSGWPLKDSDESFCRLTLRIFAQDGTEFEYDASLQ